MRISKKDALMWFEFFAQLPEEEELMTRQQELMYAVFAQIEAAVDDHVDGLKAAIKGLKTLDNRTYYVGPDSKFPGGCRSCLTGSGLGAIRRTNTCNLRCDFCYNFGQLDSIPPVGAGLWEIGGTKFYEKDISLLLSINKKPTGVSYVFLEPFMEIGLYEGIIRTFRAAGVYQHMYTNGTLANEENLRMLGEAGLDELRFNLGATGCADAVIDTIRLAKRYIARVGIETPMTPAFLDAFLLKKERILHTGLDFINCAELHLNENNLDNFAGESMYLSRMGYLSPISSRRISLELMRMADAEQWDIVVHDCSNHTKFARDLHLRAHEGGWFGASAYACEFPRIPFGAFLPTLRDDGLRFLIEEQLPPGYRPGDLVL